MNKFSELCRLCATYQTAKIDIFSENGKKRKLKEKIHNCLPIQISENDNLPRYLCFKCVFNLDNFFTFRKSCVEAVNMLKVFATQALESKVKTQPSPNASLSMVHNLLPQVSITLKTVDDEDMSEMFKPEVVMSNGNTNNVTVHPINGQDSYAENREEREEEEEEDDDMNYPMNFLELNVDPQEDNNSRDSGAPATSSLNVRMKEEHNGEKGGSPSAAAAVASASQEMLQCPLCGQRFPTRTHLLLHTSTQHGLPSFVGDDSVEITPQLNMPPARPHSCDLCGKTYTLAKHLWGHVKSAHQGHPSVTCNVCGRTFSSVANLAEHKRSRHGITASNSGGNSPLNPLKRALEAVITPGPAKIARNESAPENSTPSHKSVEGKACMLCVQRFPSTELLNAHIQSEHGIDPTQLGITPISPEPPRAATKDPPSHNSSSTPRSGVGNMHFNTPSGANVNYSSGGVSVSFNTPSGSNANYSSSPLDRTGSINFASSEPGDSVFACEICTREFGDRASLWLHMVHGHKEEAALSCGNCLKVFKDNLSLLKHVEEEHPTMQRRYSCQVCGRQHDSRKKLMKHVAIHNLYDEQGKAIDPGTMINTNNQPRRSSVYSTPSGTALRPLLPAPSAVGCQLCAKLFPSEEALLNHISTMHKTPGGYFEKMPSATLQYSCELCGSTHATRTERWNHMSQEHGGDEKITCPQAQCAKVFVSSILMQEHAAHHAEQGEFPNTCEICGKMWKSRVEYFKHVMGVHPYCLPHVCGICLKIFLTVPDLRLHVKEKHYPLEHDHSCDICGRHYTKRSKMARHREIHNVTDEIPLSSTFRIFKPKPDDMKCELCPELQVDTMAAINEHRKTVHAMFVCDLCPKYYSRSTHLWKHVNRVHKGHPDVTCKICNKVSSSRGHLEKHLIAHDNPNTEVDEPQMNEFGESVHVCHLCQKQFKQNWLLQKHKKTCKGPRRPSSPLPEPDEDGIFRCKKCIKVFVNPDIYKKHLKHSHTKAYCEVCITAPGHETKVELLQHMKTVHKDNEDYKCDIPGCDKYFRTKVDCQKHCREHKSIKSRCPTNYCTFCADLFTNRKKLWLHLKSNHKDLITYMCSACFVVEDNLKALEAHVNTKHKEIIKKPFACRLCARLVGNGVKMSEHIKLHGTHLVNCRVCGSVFHSQSELTVHAAEHRDVIPEQKPRPERKAVVNSSVEIKPEELTVSKRLRTVHTCNLCHRTFRVHGDLLKHKTSEHDIPASSEFCFVCDSQLSSAEAFRDHKCETLNKSYEEMNSSEELNDSGSSSKRRTWGDDNTPVQCDMCNKEWPSRKYLWQHLIRSHKTVAGLACGVCLKINDTYDALASHLDEVHPGYFVEEADNSTCEVCGRYHNSRPKLESHVQVHVGIDKTNALLHSCGKCNYVCRTESVLEKHEAGHTAGDVDETEDIDEDDEALEEDEDEEIDEEDEAMEDDEIDDDEDELDELDDKAGSEDEDEIGDEEDDEEEEDDVDDDDETSLDTKMSG